MRHVVADKDLLARASKDIQQEFSTKGFGSFVARWLFVVTWHNVTYYGGSTTTPVSQKRVTSIQENNNMQHQYDANRIVTLQAHDKHRNNARAYTRNACRIMIS